MTNVIYRQPAPRPEAANALARLNVGEMKRELVALFSRRQVITALSELLDTLDLDGEPRQIAFVRLMWTCAGFPSYPAYDRESLWHAALQNNWQALVPGHTPAAGAIFFGDEVGFLAKRLMDSEEDVVLVGGVFGRGQVAGMPIMQMCPSCGAPRG